MAKSEKTTATRTKKATTAAPVAAEPAVEKEEAVREAKKKKTFKSDDGIKCTSITTGGLFMVGAKTGILYQWLDAGDSIEVEYADLVAEVRSRGMYVFRPRFVVDDEDFIAEYPDLDTLYASLYSKQDLAKILQLPPAQMKEIILHMPDGAKQAVKGMAADAIDRGVLDSIARIRALDEIFGTQMLLKIDK